MTGAWLGRGRDRVLRVAIALGLCAMVATMVVSFAAMPQPLLLGFLTIAIASSAVALVLAIGSARRSGAQARVFQELLAQAAHQLRTPTATLVMELDAALADPHLAGPARELAVRLSDQVAVQGNLVERLLASARLDARVSAHGQCDAGLVLRDAQRVLGPIAEARGVPLQADVHTETLLGNEAELRELVVILGENAIVHGGGAVWIRIYADRRSSYMDVFDGGPGFSPEMSAADMPRPGRLGLELARRIVARHGGSLELSSTPRGSDVSTPAARVRLPRRKLFARNRR